MENVIGTCSLCGGQVIGHYGPWMGIVPPPAPRCTQCGATAAQHGPVIPMVPSQPTQWVPSVWDSPPDPGATTCESSHVTLSPGWNDVIWVTFECPDIKIPVGKGSSL